MGIKGTVRRSQDAHVIHSNVDTDIIVAEEFPFGSTKKPDEMYSVIEHFCLVRPALQQIRGFQGKSCTSMLSSSLQTIVSAQIPPSSALILPSLQGHRYPATTAGGIDPCEWVVGLKARVMQGWTVRRGGGGWSSLGKTTIYGPAGSQWGAPWSAPTSMLRWARCIQPPAYFTCSPRYMMRTQAHVSRMLCLPGGTCPATFM